jgi:hypothetical protein
MHFAIDVLESDLEKSLHIRIVHLSEPFRQSWEARNQKIL